ncbi:MAG: hypothetical protein ABIH39_05280 [Candidatus Margulisiibacteriota bacterium]
MFRKKIITEVNAAPKQKEAEVNPFPDWYLAEPVDLMVLEECRKIMQKVDASLSDTKIMLEDWLFDNAPEDSQHALVFWNNICFYRDRLSGMLFGGFESARFTVVGSYLIGGVKYPILKINLKEGLDIVAGGYLNIVVSVDSVKKIKGNYHHLFDPNGVIKCFPRGYPPEFYYGPYAENKKQFSLILHNEDMLLTFLYLLKDQN